LREHFGVKPNELFMDINGGDKNRVLHDLIKITEGTVQCQRGQFSCISVNCPTLNKSRIPRPEIENSKINFVIENLQIILDIKFHSSDCA
jgi:hypothetical protein